MNPVLVLCVALWCVVGPLMAFGLGQAMKIADRKERPPVEPEVLDDDDLLAGVPVECLSDAEVARRFAQIQGQLRHPSGRREFWL